MTSSCISYSLIIRYQRGKRLDGGQALDAEIRSAESQPFSSGERRLRRSIAYI